MNKMFFHILYTVLFGLFLSGCLEDRPAPFQQNLTAPTSWFAGATAARNLGGTPIGIEISWTANILAQGYKVYILSANPSTGSIGWNLVETITNGSVDSYTHRDANILVAGRIYTYKVKAIDFSGNEDANEVQQSTIGFEGITSVEILTKTTAKVIVNTAGSFSQLQVRAIPTRILPYENVAASATTVNTLTVSRVFNSSVSEIVLENLIPGTTYSFKALALTQSGDVDGNELLITKQTPSYSYGSGASTETLSSYQYRNVRLVQAYGDAPNEMNTTTLSNSAWLPASMTSLVNPHERMVRIIPNPFSTSTGQYRVIRTAGIGLLGNTAPNTFDTTTTTICAATTTGLTTTYNDNSCVVCDHYSNLSSANVSSGHCDLNFNSGIPQFIDKSLAPPKKKYFYTIVKVPTISVGGSSVRWPEELPLTNATDFLFAAHVPDAYMVLVQRDSVNYEMCALLNKTPDPRKSNNCRYRGIGGTAYNTDGVKRNTQENYYDFGYNLLVDRHALSCKWTGSETLDTTMTLPNLDNNPFLTSTRTLCSRDATSHANSGHCLRLSIGLSNNSTFRSESTPAAVAANAFENPVTPPQGTSGTCTGNGCTNGADDVAVNMPTSIPFTPSVYAANPLMLFNMQGKGNNCYAYYFSRNQIIDGAGGVTDASATDPNSRTDGSWLPVGYLADLSRNLSSLTHANFKTQITALVSNAVTVDPGPIVTVGGESFALRKRPSISGLTNTQAQALCATQNSVYGQKRLMRRREYVAAAAFPSMNGEPGYRSKADINNIISGAAGHTQYNMNANGSTALPQDDNNTVATFGGGTNATLNTNPGACVGAKSDIKNKISVNPAYCVLNGGECKVSHNYTVSKLSARYCSDTNGCTLDDAQNTSSEFFSTTDNLNQTVDQSIAGTGSINGLTPYLNVFLNPLNETASINTGNSDGNSYSSQFFIGSLATNKCLSRFGMQDPIASVSMSDSDNFYENIRTGIGIVLSDQFTQTSTLDQSSNAPVYLPKSNSLDRGAVFDYSYENGTQFIELSNNGTGYISVGLTGSASQTCTANDPDQYQPEHDWHVDNYYYLTSDSTAAFTSQQMQECKSAYHNTNNNYDRQGIPYRKASKNHTSLSGYVPVMGLPLSANATSINSNQDYVDYSSLLFSNQFSNSPTSYETYARFYSKDNTGLKTVNMTTGAKSRWSFEISESGTSNSAGSAWCAVEAE